MSKEMVTIMTTKKFTPADYLTPYEINEALRLRQKINNANSLRQIEIYEARMKNIIRKAYFRMQQGVNPGAFTNVKEAGRTKPRTKRTGKTIQGVKVEGRALKFKNAPIYGRKVNSIRKELTLKNDELQRKIRSIKEDIKNKQVQFQNTNIPNQDE
jgi:diaminopimelate decarboxylase